MVRETITSGRIISPLFFHILRFFGLLRMIFFLAPPDLLLRPLYLFFSLRFPGRSYGTLWFPRVNLSITTHTPHPTTVHRTILHPSTFPIGFFHSAQSSPRPNLPRSPFPPIFFDSKWTQPFVLPSHLTAASTQNPLKGKFSPPSPTPPKSLLLPAVVS